MSSADNEVLRTAFPDIPPAERTYTKVSYGLPFDVACKKHINGFLNCQRAYIIASKSLAAQTDNLQRLETALGPKHVGSWLGIPAHTPYGSLIPIIADMKAKQADCLVTLGGGSLADGAKVIVYALANNVTTLADLTTLATRFEHINAAAQKGIGNAPTVPIVCLPTTLSGAEYSKYGGAVDPTTHLKSMFTHPLLYASLIVLDPALTTSTPEWVWLSTGVRSIDHCVENILSPNAQPASTTACTRALPLLIKSLLAHQRDAAALAPRLQSQLAANDAMTGLTLLVMAGASHGIGHQLGPVGVGHGQTSCILLPAVLKYNAKVNAVQQESLIQAPLWADTEIAAVLAKRGLRREDSDAGDALRAVFDELGMPRGLKDVGVGRDQWRQVARNSLKDHFAATNPVPLVSEEQVLEILEMASGE